MIGIDRVILNKIKINNFDSLDTKQVSSIDQFSEYLELKNEFCELKFSAHLPDRGEEYLVSSLDFNPNRILRGDNIKNATLEEVKEALNIAVSSIRAEGVDLDISEATIRYIEINKNIPINYDDLQEVFLIIGRANYKKAFGQSNFLEGSTTAEVSRPKSLYINLKGGMYNPEKKEDSAVILAYDKAEEVKVKKKRVIDPLTRIEVKCGRDLYRNELKKVGLDNDLETLFENPEVIHQIFKDKIDKPYFENTEKYIQETLKKNLKADFLGFKRNEKIKRKKRKEFIAKGKKVPEAYKEIRGVLEYLKNESWIFDYSFLNEIIKENVEPKNIKRSLTQVERKYHFIQNYRLLKQLKNALKSRGKCDFLI